MPKDHHQNQQTTTNFHDNSFSKIADGLAALYDPPLSREEAFEAASNLVGYCRLMLEIKAQMEDNNDND